MENIKNIKIRTFPLLMVFTILFLLFISAVPALASDQSMEASPSDGIIMETNDGVSNSDTVLEPEGNKTAVETEQEATETEGTDSTLTEETEEDGNETFVAEQEATETEGTDSTLTEETEENGNETFVAEQEATETEGTASTLTEETEEDGNETFVAEQEATETEGTDSTLTEETEEDGNETFVAEQEATETEGTDSTLTEETEEDGNETFMAEQEATETEGTDSTLTEETEEDGNETFVDGQEATETEGTDSTVTEEAQEDGNGPVVAEQEATEPEGTDSTVTESEAAEEGTALTDPLQESLAESALLDPFGYVYDAITKNIISDAIVKLFQSDGTTLYENTVNTNPYTSTDGYYEFPLVEPGDYQIQASAADYFSYSLDFTQDTTIPLHQIDFYLAPLKVTDANGNEVDSGISSGWASFDGNVTIDEDLIYPGLDLAIESGDADHPFNSITVDDGVTVSTRVLANDSDDEEDGASGGDSGNITLTAPSIYINSGAMLLAHAISEGLNSYTAGDITLTAYDIGGVDAFDVFVANTDSTDTEIVVGTNAVIKGGTVQMFATSDNTVVFDEDETCEDGDDVEDILIDQTIETGIEFLESFDLIGGVAISNAEAKISIGQGSDITADTFNAVSETRINASTSPLGLGAGVAVAIGKANAEVIVDGNITTTGDCYLKAKTDNTLQAIGSASSVAGGVAFAVAVSVLDSDCTVQASSTSDLNIGGSLTLEAETIDQNYTMARSKTGDDGKVGTAVAVSYEYGDTSALLDGSADVGGDINVNALMTKESINIDKLFGSVPSAGTGVVASAGVNTSSWGDLAEDMQVATTNAITEKVKTFVTTKVKPLVSSKSSEQQQDGQKTQGQTSPFEMAAAVAVCMDTNNVTARIGDPDAADDPADVKSKGSIMVYACAESQPYIYASGSISDPSDGSEPPAGGSSDDGTKFAGSAAVAIGLYDNYVLAFIAEDASVDAAYDLIVRAEALNDWEFTYLLSAAQDFYKAYLGLGGSPTFTSSDGTVYVQTGNVVLLEDSHTAGGEAGHYYMYLADGSGDPFKELLTLSEVDYTGAKWVDLGSLEQRYSSDGEQTCASGDMVEVADGHTAGGEAGHLYQYKGSVPFEGDLSAVDYSDTDSWEDMGATWQYRSSEFVRTLSLYTNSCFGLDNYVFNNMTQSTAKGAEVSICGAVTVMELDGTAHAYIAENALINQDDDPLYRTGLQQVAVESKVVNEAMELNGNVELPGISGEGKSFKIEVSSGGTGVGGDTAGVGGTVVIITCDNESIAEIKNGAVLYGDNLRVTADTKTFNVSIAASGGDSGTFGFNGTFSLVKINNTTLAIINNGARVEVGNLLIPGTDSSLLVRANDDSFIVTISGGVAMAQSVGIGASVAINEITRDTEAYIGNPYDDPSSEGKPVSPDLTISADGPILIQAMNDGYIGSFALAAAVVKEKTDDSKKKEAPEGGGSFGMGASFEVVLNEIKDDALAYVHDAALQSTELVISSKNRTKILAAGGSMAIVTTKGTSVGLAGSYAQNTINNRTKSFTDNSDLALTGDFKAEADAGEKIFSFAASGSISTSSNSGSVAGQVSINSIASATGASILNQSNIVASNVTLKAADTSNIFAIAGALAYGGKAGIGASVALNDIPLSGRNAVTASIENSDVDASGYIDMDASSDNDIFSITAALGASKEGMAAAISVSINTIATDVSTYIIGKKSSGVQADGNLTMDALDNSSILSIAGSLAASDKASFGVAVSYNNINNTVSSHLEDTSVQALSIDINASDNASVLNITAGGSGAEEVAAGGSVSINNIDVDITSYIKNSDITADNDIKMDVQNNLQIGSIAGTVAGAGKASFGAAVATNNIGTSGDPIKVLSYIEDSKVVSEAGNIFMSALSESTIKNITGAGSGAGKVSLNGAVSVNNIYANIEAYIIDCKNLDDTRYVQAAKDITLDAADNSAISVIAATISGAGNVAAGAAVATANIGSEESPNTIKTYIENSKVTSDTESVKLTATSNSVIFNITGGIAIGGDAGINGSVSVNNLYTDTSALITSSSVVTAQKDVALRALALKREDIPQGALQVDDDDTAIDSFDGDASTSDDARDIASIQSLAGAIAGGGKAGVGAAIATNNINNNFTAAIISSDVTASDGNVILTAHSDAGIETVSAAIAGSGNFALAASVSTNQINNDVLAYISDSKVISNNSQSAPEGEVYGIILTAKDTSSISSLSGQINISGAAGLGAAFAYNEINNDVKAFADQNSDISAKASFQAIADAGSVIKTMAAGGGYGGSLSLTGSVAWNTINNNVLAYISDATVSADDGVLLDASNESEIAAIAGAIGGSSSTAVGAAVAVNDIGCSSEASDTKDDEDNDTGTQVTVTSTNPTGTKSYIYNSKVISSGGPVILSAVSDAAIKNITVAGGFSGQVAVNGAVSVNNIYTDTETFIQDCPGNVDPDLAKGVTAWGDISLTATDNAAISAITCNISIAGSAGCGAAVAINNIGKSDGANLVTASIENSKVTSKDGMVSLAATSNAFVFNITAGAGAGGTAGLQGSVSINNIYNEIAAQIITGSVVTAKNDISLSARSLERNTAPQGIMQVEDDDTTISSYDGDGSDDPRALTSIQSLAGAIAGGGTAGVGAAVATNNVTNTIHASINNSTVISEEGNVSLSATSAASIETISAALAGSGTFSLAAAVSTNKIENQVLAYILNSTVTANVDQSETGIVSGIFLNAADNSSIQSLSGQFNFSVSGGGIGAAVAINEINNTVKAYTQDSTITTPSTFAEDASSSAIIKTIAAGGGVSQYLAATGSIAKNTVNNDVLAYITGSEVSADQGVAVASSNNSEISAIAGAVSISIGGSVGASVAINDIGCTSSESDSKDEDGNDTGTQVEITGTDPTGTKSYIENSKVVSTGGAITLSAVSNSEIKAVAAAGGGGIVGINGAITLNNIYTDTEAYITNCRDDLTPSEKYITADGDVTISATDNSAASVIAGNVSVGAVGAGAAISTVNIGNETQRNQVKAYIENSRVSSGGAITLEANSSAFIFNIAAGISGGAAGIQGSVAINNVYNDIAALISSGSEVTANNNICLSALSQKRETISQGMLQAGDSDEEVSTFDGNTTDEDDDGQATSHTLKTIQSLAGGVAGGGYGGIGAAVATNNIANIIQAGIVNSTVTSNEGNVVLTADSDVTLETVSAAIAGGGTFALAGAVSLNNIDNQVLACVIGSDVTSNNNSDDIVDDQVPGITVQAADDSTIRSLAGQLSISSSAGIGGAAAYNEINNTVKAFVDKGINGSVLNTSGSILIAADSASTIESISAGGSLSCGGSAAGSVSINLIGNITEAYIVHSTANADDNIYLLADSESTINGCGGALAGGLVGVGAAVVVNTVENTTRAYTDHAVIKALGTGNVIEIKHWTENGSESSASIKGLAIIADCDDQITMYSGALSGGMGAVSGQVSVNKVADLTEAYITSSNVNTAAQYGELVKVIAHQGTDVDIYAGGLSIGGTAIGAAVDHTSILNRTAAFISNADESGNDTTKVDSLVYARGVEVKTVTKEDADTYIAGAALAGGVSVAGSVSVVDIDCSNDAYIKSSDVFSNGNLYVRAYDTADINTITGAVSLSGFAGAGGASAVNSITNETKAQVIGSDLNATGAIEIKAKTDDTINTLVGTAGVGVCGGLAGAVSVNSIDATTEAVVRSGSVRSTINQAANYRPGGLFAPDTSQTVTIQADNTSTIDNTGGALAGGLYAGIGATVDVASIKNRTAAHIGTGTRIYAKGNVNVKAISDKTIYSSTTTISGGLLGVSGSISVISIGSAADGRAGEEFNRDNDGDSLMQQLNGDVDISSLSVSNDGTAQRANGKLSGLNTPDLDNLLGTNQDNSTRVTAAYIESATGTSSQVVIVSDGDILIQADNTSYIKSEPGQAGIGLAAVGASVGIVNTNEKTEAYIGDYGYIRAANLTVKAESDETALVDGAAVVGGMLFGVGANIARVTINPEVIAYTGSYSNISAQENIEITATVVPETSANIAGITVSAGISVGVAEATAQVNPVVTAYIGDNSIIVAGSQPMTGNPTLTFTTAAILSGTPTLEFKNNSANITGDPSLIFAPNADAGDVIIRNKGSWLEDGFEAGDHIWVIASENSANNGVYEVASVTVDSIRLVAKDVLTIETISSGAQVYTDEPATITRSTGDWNSEGFYAGQLINITGSASNDGFYEIWGISEDGLTMEINKSYTLVNETVTAGTDGVAIKGELNDRIERSTGSWSDDGFEAGQTIRIAGTSLNDGSYVVNSISADGKYLILESEDEFLSETAAGVVITIPELIASEFTVNALQLLPDDGTGTTANAEAFGCSGGLLVGYNATKAKAENNSTVKAYIGQDSTINSSGLIEVNAYVFSQETAKGDAYNLGLLVAKGNNVVEANSNNTTEAAINSGVGIEALELRVTAYENSYNYADAMAGSGGLVSGMAAEASTENNSTTTASIGNSNNIKVEQLLLTADHTAEFNAKVNTVNAGVVDCSGGDADNQVDASVSANIGDNSNIEAYNIIVSASNRSVKDWLPGDAYNAKSGSGGVVSLPATKSNTDITHTTAINVGTGTFINVIGDPFDPGELTLNALNDVYARDKVKLDAGGAIAWAKAESIINANSLDASVTIGQNAELDSVGDINLSARTRADIETDCNVNTYGAAGAAEGASVSYAKANNDITVGPDATLYSEGTINLLAGRNVADQVNTFNLQADTYLRNDTAFPVETDPDATSKVNQTNNITINGGALLECVKDANLLTESGITILHGEGIGKDFYRDVVGAEIKGGETTINNHSTVRVDGTVNVGIRNSQVLIINEDGSIQEQSDGVTYTIKSDLLSNSLLQELDRLLVLAAQYAGTEAGDAFEAQIEFVLRDLEAMGNEVTYDGDGNPIVQRDLTVDFIIVDDIWAQSSNINVTGDYLVGSGSLMAPGNAEIKIINNSPAYLRVNRLTIPATEGGNLVFNSENVMNNSGINEANQTMGAGVNFANITTSATSQAPLIEVKNTYYEAGTRAPDIQLMGEINNVGNSERLGVVNITSTGSVSSLSDINAGTLNIDASGNFTQSYIDTYYNVGGETSTQWGWVSTGRENDTKTRLAAQLWARRYPSGYEVWERNAINSYINNTILNEANRDNQDPDLSEIRAANIFIAARYLNINGLIEAGHATQEITLGSTINNMIASYKAANTMSTNYLDYPLVQESDLKFYYDPVNDRIVLEDVGVHGGYIELFGQIISTGTGKIVALDGYGTIDVDNQTDYSLAIQSLDTGSGSHGVIKITDTSKKTTIGDETYYLVTRYNRVYDDDTQTYSIETRTWYSNVNGDNVSAVTASGSTAWYNPTTGYRYVYVTGQDATQKETYVYGSSSWAGIDWLSKDPDSLYSYDLEYTGDPVLLDDGEYLVYDPNNAGEPYMYWYESIDLSERKLVFQDEWTTKGGFLGLKKTYWTKVIYETGVKDVHYHSVKADYPILIEFAGGLEGVIYVKSSQDIILEGPINNRLGETTLIADGAIEQTSDSVISSKNITLNAGTGIGNSLEILIDLLGGMLRADTDTGDVNIREVSGALNLGSATTGDGDVYLTAPTNIVAASYKSLVKGNQIDLNAGGYIGTQEQPLQIDTGDAEGSGISAAAQSDIYLKEMEGSLPVITIASAGGSVFITTVNGGMTDADGMQEQDTITAGELLDFWSDSGVIGSGDDGNLYTAAAIGQLLASSLQKPLADTEYRLEEMNITGNNITLNISQGIGDIRTYRIDFTNGVVKLSDETRLLLTAAERGDVLFYDANDNPVDPDDPGAAYMIISLHEDVDIKADGSIAINAGSDVYLGSEQDIYISSLTGGNTRIKGGGGIYGAEGCTTPLITGCDLILEAADGTIGTAEQPVTVTVLDADSRELIARANEDIYLRGVADAGQPGAFNIDFIYSPVNVKLAADGFIRDANTDSLENINAESLEIAAGSIGTSDNLLEIKLAADGLLKAMASAGGIYMEERYGDINALEVTTSTGDVVLKAAGAILDAQDEQAGQMTNIAGRNITLVAVDGGIGTPDNYLEINSANGGTGSFSADSCGNIYVEEESNDLTLGRVVSDAIVYLISPGNILNGAAAGYNIEGTKFWFDADGGVGTEAKPLLTRVNNIEGTAAAGPVWITNTGGLTVGGIEEGTNGIGSGGAVHLTAQSPITVDEDIIAGAEIMLTSTDSANTGDDITVNSGVLVQSNGDITLRAGDNIYLVPGSLLNAVDGRVTLLGDYGNADSGVGSTIDIRGTILALVIKARGKVDNDTFNLDVRTLSSPVTMLGGDGSDNFNVILLPDLISYHGGVRDTVTLDGQEGADIYTIDVTSSSDNIINVWDTGTTAGDILNINGTSGADNFLLREKFVAVLQPTETGYADGFERINYDSQIEDLIINAGNGDDNFYLDDNCTQTEINGEDGNDYFQIGQMFGSARTAGDETGILTGDDIRTVHTTRGYLSRGISEATTINGGEGGDTFSVYSNLAPLKLNGDNGNDNFIVRAFALAEDETESQEMTNVYGGDGDDTIAYHVNAPVDIDGGNGYDTLIVIGTEYGDGFIITADGVYGAGLNVVFCNIEAADVDGMEGDDHFFIQSTNSNMVTRIFGGLGSDTFYINGDVIESVVTSNSDLDTIVTHDLASIAGPLYIFGGLDEEADRTVKPGVKLPYENDVELPVVVIDTDETQMQDALYIYNEDAGSSSGTLTGDNLSGLGMGTDLTLNTGTEETPNWVTHKGGITYQDLEIMEILLGAENDSLNITGSAEGTITAVHGGGGSDTIIATGNSGPLVIYGDSREDNSRYTNNDPTVASWYGHSYSNPAGDIIDASASSYGVIIYGGSGDDTIYGSQAGDHLAGGSGIDTIYGEAGDDIIYGDSGFNVDLWNRLISVPTTEAVSGDTIYGGSGNDIVFGDHGTITQTGQDAGILTVVTTGQVEVIETTNISSGGDDSIYGDAGDDILIGGSGTDTIAGNADQDLIFGDNVRLEAGTDSNVAYTRYRMLTGDTIYDENDMAMIEVTPYTYIGMPLFWSGYEITVNNGGVVGDDILSGGDGNDMIFGQSGMDVIHGGDGDDYIEGGCDDDTIYGDMGQDDIIGGNSSLFGLTYDGRQDGADIIYGGTGTDVDRNTLGDGTTDGHAADADVILGDNGNIYRLVDSMGAYLTFNYDNYGDLKIVPRAVTLIDYTLGGADYDAAAAASDIGGADIIHGEAGDDIIYGMAGNDILYGEGQDDDIIGGWGNDWISGGTGDDGIIGDDGRIYTSRNGMDEPLYGIVAATETYIEGTKTLTATINIAGLLNKSVNLTPFNLSADGDVFFDPLYADDIIYGGLGNDFIHGGSGDDAISGTEALPEYYNNPYNVGDVLKYDETTSLFAAYNPYAPMSKIMVDEYGAWTPSGGIEFLLNFNASELDGNDVIFGDLGNDWLVGGPGKDQLFGGFGDDLLNADDDHSSADDNTAADIPPADMPADYYDDIVFGGGGRDVLIASSEGDGMVDWTGEYNSYIVPSSKFGPGTVIRYHTKAIEAFLYALAVGGGVDTTAGSYADGADPARYYEPYGEIGLVTVGDPFAKDLNGAPRDPQPGNKGGQKK